MSVPVQLIHKSLKPQLQHQELVRVICLSPNLLVDNSLYRGGVEKIAS